MSVLQRFQAVCSGGDVPSLDEFKRKFKDAVHVEFENALKCTSLSLSEWGELLATLGYEAGSPEAQNVLSIVEDKFKKQEPSGASEHTELDAFYPWGLANPNTEQFFERVHTRACTHKHTHTRARAHAHTHAHARATLRETTHATLVRMRTLLRPRYPGVLLTRVRTWLIGRRTGSMLQIQKTEAYITPSRFFEERSRT